MQNAKEYKAEYNAPECVIDTGADYVHTKAHQAAYDFVGYRHFADFKIIRKAATRRLKKLLHALETGEVDQELFDKSLQSRLAYIEKADAFNLCADIRQQVKNIKLITIGRFESVLSG